MSADQSNETARQREVDLYRLVDSLPEAAYDDIARLAALVCGAPIALVSLIDRDRQWFKAHVGFATSETAREDAVCNHAIAEPGRLFEVPDLSRDPRFAANPLVTGEDRARFYAGMPLVTPAGAAVGTVCVLDREPRELSSDQRNALAALARLAMNLMEAGKREREYRLQADLEPPARTTPAGQPYTIAILQVQDFADAVKRQGERGVEKLMQQLDEVLDAALAPGDSVSRVTGTGESVALLQGDASAALQLLRHRADAFRERTGLRLLVCSACATSVDESPELVYLRADEALSAEKDRLRPAYAA